MSSIGKRYATAILDLAAAEHSEEKTGRDLLDLGNMWASSVELRNAFENPKITAQQRKDLLNDLATRAGLSPMLRNTLLVLADNLRMSDLPDIARAYQALASERGGSVKAEVTSATSLPEAYYTELARTLESVVGRKVTIERKLDPTLIAGVVTKVGDKVFDGSIRNRLNELKDELLDA